MRTAVTRVGSARKPWLCFICGSRIDVGQEYMRIHKSGRPVRVVHMSASDCRRAVTVSEEGAQDV